MRLLHLLKLFIITNGYTYDNELCSPDNWMIVEGDSWSFDNESCSATTNTDHSMAMLVYKTWPFLSQTQNESYRLVIEYNFTMTAAENDNRRGTVGVVWYPDSNVYNYMALSLAGNEALVAYGNGISTHFSYDHWEITREGNFSYVNKGALPFTFSVDTFYSMRISIGYILYNNIWAHIRVNGVSIFGYTSYSEPFGSNNSNMSWIGLKSEHADVISHSLSVYQTSNINDGQSIIQRFKSFGAWQTTTEALITTSTMYESSSSTIEPAEDETEAAEDLESTYSVEEVPVSGVLGVSWLNMTTLLILLALIVCCCFCCIILLGYLLVLPKKAKKVKVKIVTKMLPMHNHQNQQHVKAEGEREDAPTVVMQKSSLSLPTIPTLSFEPDLQRQNTPEGGKRNAFRCVCNAVLNNPEILNTSGEIYCRKCHPEYFQNDEVMEDDACGDIIKTPESGKEVMIVERENNKEINKGVKHGIGCKVEPEANKKATMRNEPQNKSHHCVDCGARKRGKVDPENGLFHCNKCSEDYVHDDLYDEHEPQLMIVANSPKGNKALNVEGENYHRSIKKALENKSNPCVDCGARKKGKIDQENGLFHCNECWEDYVQDDDMYDVHEPKLTIVANSPKGNNVKHGIGFRICGDCTQKKMGRCDEDGSFYCNDCWKHYEKDDVDTAGYIQ